MRTWISHADTKHIKLLRCFWLWIQKHSGSWNGSSHLSLFFRWAILVFSVLELIRALNAGKHYFQVLYTHDIIMDKQESTIIHAFRTFSIYKSILIDSKISTRSKSITIFLTLESVLSSPLMIPFRFFRKWLKFIRSFRIIGSNLCLFRMIF